MVKEEKAQMVLLDEAEALVPEMEKKLAELKKSHNHNTCIHPSSDCRMFEP